jgi:hypothetical protein
MGGSRPAPAPAPPPAPVVEKKEDPSEVLRRKRIAEGRASGSTTGEGDGGSATKRLLGN